jgi:hypothetical protein
MLIKHPYKTSSDWSFMSWIDIPSKVNPGHVYLRRLRVLGTPLFSIYVHFIFEKDPDLHPHDHPWRFWSFILRGGYDEEVHTRINMLDWNKEMKTWRRWTLHRFELSWAHKITYIQRGTISLIFTGRRVHKWGFYTTSGFVPYDKYPYVIESLSNDPFNH